MINFSPLVSIIIPVYNGENYLAEAIDSALAQSYTNIEILVINDGSVDNTSEIAKSYGNRIRYFEKENGGQSTALNLGIESMKGEYFSWLSHDDLYHPEKVTTQIDILKDLAVKDTILYSDWEKIDQHGKSIGFGSGKVINGHILLDMLLASPVNGCTLLIHKSLFEIHGSFNPQRPHTSDVELFFKMAQSVEFKYIPKPMVKMRVHSQQATFRRIKYHISESNLFLIDSAKVLISRDFEIPVPPKHKLLQSFAINWSNRGYYKAYRFIIQELMQSNKGKFVLLRMHCIILFLKKNARNHLSLLRLKSSI